MLSGPVQEEVGSPKLSADLLEVGGASSLKEGLLAGGLSFVEAEGSGEVCPLAATSHDAYRPHNPQAPRPFRLGRHG